ncbi:MAG: restriction endonuclease subunit S [Limisphaerales bacterium]
MRWTDSTLGEVVSNDRGLIQTGPFGSQLHQSDYIDEGTPVIMPTDILDGRVMVDRIARVSEQTADRLSRHKLKPRTIVLPRRGEITKRAFIREDEEGWLCGSGCLKIEVQETDLVPEFLYYHMAQHEVVQWLEQHAVGSTMLNLSAGIVNEMPIRYPLRDEQYKIARVLSAYDDLIENNRRRMALLENAARLLYQEWFVRLRFPGHEHTRITNGIPEGWERVPLEDALVLQRGFDLTERDREDGQVPVYGSSGQHGWHNKAMAKGPGVVTGRSGTLGQVHYVEDDFWPHNTALWVREFRKVTPLFSLFLLREMRLEQYNGGASVPTLDRKAVHRVPVLIPAQKFIGLLEDYLTPTFGQLRNLSQQSQKLRAALDLLLPRLMSGEVQI